MQPISQNAHESAPVSEGSPLPAPSLADTPTTACTPDQESASQILADLTVATVPSLAHAPQPPGHFGPYVLLQEIARGGMGVVFRARHEVLGREVALKTIQSAHQVKPELVTRFYQEAQAVAQLKHPNIIQIFDFGIIEGRHYFTMALAEGSLLSKLAHYQADQHAAVAVIEKVARAVQHVHESGLLHRDLKPGNILLDQGEPLVSDFGLAKSLELELELTRTGSAIGTPAYMAPEQAAGRGDQVCPQTDVWSLGVILYELLCGKKPFGGGSREEVIRAIQEDDPAAPRSLQPRLDRNLEAILQKCLEKEAKRRYGSAGALADDLGAWLRKEPIKARPLGHIGRIARWIRRHRVSTAVAGFLGALALATLLIVDRFDPDRNLRPLQHALADKQAVTLLGPKGPPAWWRWQVPGAVLSQGAEEIYSLHSGSRSLLELLPNVPLERFRLSAEVKQEASHEGKVGIYIAHQAFAAADGPYHSFIALSFNEVGKLRIDANSAPQAQVQLQAFHHYEPRIGRYVLRHADLAPPHHWPPRQKGEAIPWRSLAIEVTPERIASYWGEKAIGAVTTEWKLRHAKFMTLHRHLVIEQVPDFPCAGGLGLVVDSGIASFRNVELRPLPD